MQILAFASLGERYCCDLSYVVRVVKVSALQSVPNTPGYLKGLMDYYGQQLPVFDLVESLDRQGCASYTLETPVILLEYQEQCFGLIVDQVDGVSYVDADQLMPLPSKGGGGLLSNSVYVDKKPAFFLDIEQY